MNLLQMFLLLCRQQTMPNVWFKQFSLDEKNNAVQLSGESDDMDAFSRQVAVFENNKYVKSIGTLSSSLGESARVEFNVNLVLDPNIFNYLSIYVFLRSSLRQARSAEANQTAASEATSSYNRVTQMYNTPANGEQDSSNQK